MNSTKEQSWAEPLTWGAAFFLVMVITPFVMVFASALKKGTDVDQSPLFLVLVAPLMGVGALLFGALVAVLLRDHTRLSRFQRSCVLFVILVTIVLAWWLQIWQAPIGNANVSDTIGRRVEQGAQTDGFAARLALIVPRPGRCRP